MFARVKESRNGEYLQIVENYRDGDRVRQRMVLYVGHYASVENALEYMPRDRRRWRAHATRTGLEWARREAERLARTLEALRRLVDEHPDLVARDRARAERHRRRKVDPVIEARYKAREARLLAGYTRCQKPGADCDRWAFVSKKDLGHWRHLCQEHYEEERQADERMAKRNAERMARTSERYE